jgi:glycosyltransferase involved in cell wall biosynthesis
MTERCVAILGRRDEPTDAVEEYCQYLGRALSKQGIQLEIIRVRWSELGWRESLRGLRREMKESQATWAAVQYTTLSWSRRGFPVRLLKVIQAVQESGKRCAAVFHDAGPYGGQRVVDRIRRQIQLYTMRRAVRLVNLTVLTIPREKVTWMPEDAQRAVFIPVGANLPQPEAAWKAKRENQEKPAIAVYSVTGGSAEEIEVKRIEEAVRLASEKLGPIRLSVFGRNSEAGGKKLQERLAGSQVEVVVHGMLRAEEIVRELGCSDALLFVRGTISSRRGSALAGIACGLPVVAYEGQETAEPITEAGVVLLPENSENEFGPALVRVLQDSTFRAALRERNFHAQSKYFSWDVIAAQYAAALRDRKHIAE